MCEEHYKLRQLHTKRPDCSACASRRTASFPGVLTLHLLFFQIDQRRVQVHNSITLLSSYQESSWVHFCRCHLKFLFPKRVAAGPWLQELDGPEGAPSSRPLCVVDSGRIEPGAFTLCPALFSPARQCPQCSARASATIPCAPAAARTRARIDQIHLFCAMWFVCGYFLNLFKEMLTLRFIVIFNTFSSICVYNVSFHTQVFLCLDFFLKIQC